MLTKYQHKLRIVCATFLLLLVLLGVGSTFAPKTAQAQGLNVPIGTTFDFQSIMKYLKDFVLDKLAYLIAKQILHQMTLSVVNWINSGFQGNPAFINNPAGFFEDAADQITGNFLTGPLQGLCSPFSLNIRLALALQQTNGYQQRYACTLSQVIKAQQQTLARAQNGTLVNLSVAQGTGGATVNSIANGDILHDSSQLSVNGNSVGGISSGFTNNFAQDGGWAGWLAMTGESQNNMYGAYLMAQSDLAEQIAAKKAAVDNDLNRGNGFLSYQSCKDVTSQQALNAANVSGNTRAAQQIQNANFSSDLNSSQTYLNNIGLGVTTKQPTTQNLSLGNGSTIQKTIDTKGNLSYQDCETVTPGSVIADTLMQSTHAPIVEAELANDINSILNALVSQMVSTMLNQGLSGLSRNGTGKNGKSYTQTVLDDVQDQNNKIANKANKDVKDQLISSVSGLQAYKNIYDQAVTLVTTSKNSLLTAAACFATKMAPPATLQSYQTDHANTQIAAINAEVLKVNAVLDPLVAQQTSAQNQIEALQNATTTAAQFTNDDSTAAYQAEIDQIQGQVNQAKGVASTTISAGTTVAKGTVQANKDLTDAEKQAVTFNNDAVTFQHDCDGFPGNVSITGSTFSN